MLASKIRTSLPNYFKLAPVVNNYPINRKLLPLHASLCLEGLLSDEKDDRGKFTVKTFAMKFSSVVNKEVIEVVDLRRLRVSSTEFTTIVEKLLELPKLTYVDLTRAALDHDKCWKDLERLLNKQSVQFISYPYSSSLRKNVQNNEQYILKIILDRKTLQDDFYRDDK